MPNVPNVPNVSKMCPKCAQVELAKRSGYTVVSGDGVSKLFYLDNMNEADADLKEVDMRRGMQSVNCCEHVHIHKQPCRHMVCVFWKLGMLRGKRKVAQCVNKFWPKWSIANVLLQAYISKSVARPQIYGGKFVGNHDDRIKPPKQSAKKRGRPKKKRYKYRKQTVKSIKQRMPTVYNAQYASVLDYF